LFVILVTGEKDKYRDERAKVLFSTAGQKDGQKDGQNEGKSKAAVKPPLFNVGPVKAADKPMQDVFLHGRVNFSRRTLIQREGRTVEVG
jgi:hypothetical protein